MFREHVGIDYSGAGAPDAGCSGLRVYRSADGSIDHCFSLPKAWLDRRCLGTWDHFLADFAARWPTDRRAVAACRTARAYEAERARLRLCERWTSSAKSVFQFGMNGQVATSSHAGIPWLRWLRARLGPSVHFWPFDGWRVAGDRHVVAEVYPSIFRNRFPRAARTADQQDAFAVAEWLRTRDAAGLLAAYFEPPLTPEERHVAAVEGWILGLL